MLIGWLFRNRKVLIRGRRVHHGLTGLALIAIGALLCADDALDARRWISDFRRPRYRS